MSKFISVPNGDIKLTVTGSGNVILDTEGGSDVLVRTGSGTFSVTGSETNLESDNLYVSDNLFTINSGELGSGVTAGESGFEINRGGLPNVKLAYKEGDDVFEFSDDTGDLVGIRTDVITSSSDVLFSPTGVVLTDFDYASRVDSHPAIQDAVPNVQWVNTAIDTAIDEYQQLGTYQLSRGIDNYTQVTTRHISEGDETNSITFLVDDKLVGRMTDEYFDYNYLRFRTKNDEFGKNPIIETKVPGKDLVLKAETGGSPNNNGSVRVDYVFELTGQLSPDAINNIVYPGYKSSIVIPEEDYVEGYSTEDAYVSDFGDPDSESDNDYIDRVNLYDENTNGVKIVGSVEGEGGTGIYFINGSNTRDELISRQRSLFISMMF